MRVKVENGVIVQSPYGRNEIKQEPVTITVDGVTRSYMRSLPNELTEEAYQALGSFKVVYQPVPEYDNATQALVYSDGPVMVEGVPTVTCSVRAKTPEEVEAYLQKQQDGLTIIVQKHMDNTAQTRGYDGIVSLASYATSTSTRFQPEGQAGVEWRDAVWTKCYEIIDAVRAGTRSVPDKQTLLAELPEIAWPS